MAESSTRNFNVPPDDMPGRAQSHANLLSRVIDMRKSQGRESFYDVRIDGQIYIKRTQDAAMLEFIADAVHPGITNEVEFSV